MSIESAEHRTEFARLSGGHTIATVDLNPDVITGVGSIHAPFLRIPMKLLLCVPGTPARIPDTVFGLLTGTVVIKAGDTSVRLGAMEPIQVNIRLSAVTKANSYDGDIYIPISVRALAMIEENRNPHVSIEVFLHLGVSLSHVDKDYIGQAMTLQASVHRIITREVWIKKVTEPTGYNHIRIIEIPFKPFATGSKLYQSMAALEQATEYLREGRYDEVPAKCRIALEGYFKYDKGAKRMALRPEWVDTLGKSTYDWLDASLFGIRDDGHESHHNVNIGVLPFDAQMLLTVTTVLLAYLGRRVSKARKVIKKPVLDH